MQEQGDGACGSQGSQGRPSGAAAVARVDQELAQLGVAEPERSELARRLAPMICGLPDEAYAAALAGAALAVNVHRAQANALRRGLQDLREVERLLGAFGQELCRLDEALRMLAREMQRAEERPPALRSRMIH
jgi:hypothetical protein